VKTLIINGSPRKNGDTITLLSEFKKHLQGEIIQIDTFFTDIKPCNDCRYCWENQACVIKDGMQDVYRLIDETDNIIIASPIYFAELTGSLLNFMSRLQFFYTTKYKRNEVFLSNKKRNGVVFLVGGGNGTGDQALKTAKLLLRVMGADYLDCVLSHNTDNVPAKDDTDALNKVKEIAIKLEE